MSLEQAVHQRWAAAGALASLLPIENLTTGISCGESLPYATMVRKKGRTSLRTNAGATLEEVILRFNVWHDDHDAGRDIADEVKAAFDGAGFSLSSGASVIRMRRTEEGSSQSDDGTWHFVLEFLVHVYLPTGA